MLDSRCRLLRCEFRRSSCKRLSAQNRLEISTVLFAFANDRGEKRGLLSCSGRCAREWLGQLARIQVTRCVKQRVSPRKTVQSAVDLRSFCEDAGRIEGLLQVRTCGSRIPKDIRSVGLLLLWRDGLFGVPERLSWKEPREQVEASILSSNLPELRSGRSNLAQGWPCTIFSFERDFGMSSCRDCSGTCQKSWHPKARLSAPMQSGQRRSPDIAGAKRARNADSPLSTHVLICLK